MDDETPLEKTERHIRETEEHIAQQERVVAELEREGREEAAETARTLLASMRATLDVAREHRRILLESPAGLKRNERAER